jgi:nitroreductase
MTQKRINLTELTLWGAAKSYVVYLHSLRLPYARYQALVRALRPVLIFYGYGFPLTKFSRKRVLQYADIYNPFDDDPIYRIAAQSIMLGAAEKGLGGCMIGSIKRAELAAALNLPPQEVFPFHTAQDRDAELAS